MDRYDLTRSSCYDYKMLTIYLNGIVYFGKKYIVVNKLILLELSLLFVITFGANAQNIKKDFPVSPVASKLIELDNSPPDLFTGTNLERISLAKISLKGMNIPIELVYASNGLKVSAQPTFSGLSWTLKYGGVITRTVKDEPDRINPFTAYDSTILPPEVVNEISSSNNALYLKDFALKTSEEGFDSEPDQFSFSFLGENGTFIITNQGEIISDTKSNLLITLTDYDFEKGFVITDEYGVKFFFTKREITSVSSGPSANLTAITAWYLTKVSQPSAGDIIYTYKDIVCGDPSVATESFNVVSDYQIDDADPSVSDELRSRNGYKNGNSPSTTYYGCLPDKIIAPNTSVEFLFQQLSTQQTYHVSSVLIKNTATTNGNPSIIDQINFDYLTTSNGRVFLRNINYLDGRSYQLEYFSPESFPQRSSKSIDHWGFYNGEDNSTLIPYDIELLNTRYGERKANKSLIETGMLKSITYPTKGRTEFLYEPNYYDGIEYVKTWENISVSGTAGEFSSGVVFQSSVFHLNYAEVKLMISSVSLANECANSTDPDVIGKIRAVLRIKNIDNGSFVVFNNGDSQFTLNKGSQENVLFDIDNFSAGNYQLVLMLYGCVKASLIINYNEQFVPKDVKKFAGGVRLMQEKLAGGGDSKDIFRTFKYGKINSAVESGVPFNEIIDYKNTKKLAIFYLGDQGLGWSYPTYSSYKHTTLGEIAKGLFDNQGHSIVYPTVCEIIKDQDQEQVTEYHFKNVTNEKVASLIKGFENNGFQYEYNNSAWGKGLTDSICYYTKNENQYKLVKIDRKIYTYDAQNSSSFSYLKTIKNFNSYCDNVSVISKNGVLVNGGGGFDCLRLKTYQETYIAKSSLESPSFQYYICQTNHTHEREIDVDGFKKCVAVNNQNKEIVLQNPFYTLNEDEYTFQATSHLEVAKAKFYSHRFFLSEMQSVTFGNNGSVVESTLYDYDNKKYLLCSKKTQIDGKGNKIGSYFIYPVDYTNQPGFVKSLKDNHIIGSPIETINIKETGNKQEVLNSSLSVYDNLGKGLLTQQLGFFTVRNLPVESFKISNKLLGSSFQTGNITGYSPDPRYQELYRYVSYDSYGNPLELKEKELQVTSYIWGYNGQYPIAKIINATQTEVALALGTTASTILANLNLQNVTEAYINETVKTIRESLKNAHVTTFTYAPLVGMKSMTDSKGMTITYEYDGFQRLKTVKNAKGEILKTYDYHYK